MSSNEILIKTSNSKGKVLKDYLLNAGGGVAQTLFWDQFLHKDVPDNKLSDTFRSFTPESFKEDPGRTYMNALNMILGTLGTRYMRKGNISAEEMAKIDTVAAGDPLRVEFLLDRAERQAQGNYNKGMGLNLGIPTKDLVISGTSLAQNVNRKIPSLLEAANKTVPTSNEFSTRDKLIAAAIGVGALGLGAYGINRLGKGMDQKALASNSGRVTLTLPTKDPNDVETQVSIPLADTGVSAKTYQQLGRDVRRRLRSESNERKKRYLEALEIGQDPIEAGLFKTSTESKPMQSFLSGSHIKSIAEAHAPIDEEQQAESANTTEQKPDLKPLNSKLSEQNKKLSEQEKRIKQLEKYLGQVNGNKLSRVRDNLRGLGKKAAAPSLTEVNSTPEAFGAKGGIMGNNIFKPSIFGPRGDKFYNSFVRPFIGQASNPLLQKLFGYTRPNPNAIVPIGPV